MEEKLSKFKVEVQQGQEDAAARVLKRARYEKPYALRERETRSRQSM